MSTNARRWTAKATRHQARRFCADPGDPIERGADHRAGACMIAAVTRWLLLSMLAATSNALANGIESHERIQRVAHALLESMAPAHVAPAEIRINPPDPRLRLGACSQEPSAFLVPGARLSGNVVVGVRCEGARPWKFYLTARVQVFEEVLVLERPVPRGTRLQESDFSVQVRDASALRGEYLSTPAQAVGLLTRRALGAGAVLDMSALEVRRMVKRGQQVVVIAQAGALEVRGAGKALADGGEGDLVRIQNARTERIVEGVVTAPGVVVVAF